MKLLNRLRALVGLAPSRADVFEPAEDSVLASTRALASDPRHVSSVLAKMARQLDAAVLRFQAAASEDRPTAGVEAVHAIADVAIGSGHTALRDQLKAIETRISVVHRITAQDAATVDRCAADLDRHLRRQPEWAGRG